MIERLPDGPEALESVLEKARVARRGAGG